MGLLHGLDQKPRERGELTTVNTLSVSTLIHEADRVTACKDEDRRITGLVEVAWMVVIDIIVTLAIDLQLDPWTRSRGNTQEGHAEEVNTSHRASKYSSAGLVRIPDVRLDIVKDDNIASVT